MEGRRIPQAKNNCSGKLSFFVSSTQTQIKIMRGGRGRGRGRGRKKTKKRHTPPKTDEEKKRKMARRTSPRPALKPTDEVSGSFFRL